VRDLRRTCLLVAVSCAAMACATGGRRVSGSNCQLSASDSAYLDGGPVYRDCAVDTRARLLDSRVNSDFQPGDPRFGGRQCYSAVIAFVVDTAGAPEPQTVRVVRTNDQSFADALIRVLPRLRYQPAHKNTRPVRQIVEYGQVVSLVAVPVPRTPSVPPC
jgi:hypothetical protein